MTHFICEKDFADECYRLTMASSFKENYQKKLMIEFFPIINKTVFKVFALIEGNVEECYVLETLKEAIEIYNHF